VDVARVELASSKLKVYQTTRLVVFCYINTNLKQQTLCWWCLVEDQQQSQTNCYLAWCLSSFTIIRHHHKRCAAT